MVVAICGYYETLTSEITLDKEKATYMYWIMSGKAETDDRNSQKGVWNPIFFSSQWLNCCKKAARSQVLPPCQVLSWKVGTWFYPSVILWSTSFFPHCKGKGSLECEENQTNAWK